MKIKLSPSLERADLLNMERECRDLQEAGVSYYHFDVMDYTLYGTTKLSPDMVPMITSKFTVPVDVHITTTYPEEYLNAVYPNIKDNYLTFYAETTSGGMQICKEVLARGGKCAVSIYPGTPLCMVEEFFPFVSFVNLIVKDSRAGEKTIHPSMLDKIARLRKMLDERGYQDVEIAVDGSIDYPDIKGLLDAGATILILGSKTAFKPGQPIKENIKQIKDYINELGYEAE